jgi:hypothetical protein
VGTVAPTDEKQVLADELGQARALIEKGKYTRALDRLTSAREVAQEQGDREALDEVRGLARAVWRRAPRGSDTSERADGLVLAIGQGLTVLAGAGLTLPPNLRSTPLPAGSSRGSSGEQVLEARRLVARSRYAQALDLLERTQPAAAVQGDTETLNEIGTVAQLISIQTTGPVRRRAMRLHRQMAVVEAHEQALGVWQLVVVVAWLVVSGVVGATAQTSDWFPRSFWVFLSLTFFAGVAYCVYCLGVLTFSAWRR